MAEKKKIALIIQRYGNDITGGAEWHCAQIATRLKPFYEIDVLTTCAKEYTTWAPILNVGTEVENGITIKRFSNSPRASKYKLRYIRHKITNRLWYQWLARKIGIYKQLQFLHPTDSDHEQWLIYQGPYSPNLISYIENNQGNYQKLIFFSALYYPSAVGVQLFPEKSILIPMLHDEKANYYPVYQKVFGLKCAFFFNTITESKIADKIYGNTVRKQTIVGVGIDDIEASTIGMVLASKIDKPFIFYAGRIDKLKGCEELIQFFLRYTNEQNENLKLVFAGHNYMKPIRHPAIEYVGYVSDEQKNALMAGAMAIVVPSFFESLSLLMLEAMQQKKPVLVNKKCDVLVEHATASKAAFAYFDYNSFKEYLKELVSNAELRIQMGNLGKAYVQKNYSWEEVQRKYRVSIDS